MKPKHIQVFFLLTIFLFDVSRSDGDVCDISGKKENGHFCEGQNSETTHTEKTDTSKVENIETENVDLKYVEPENGESINVESENAKTETAEIENVNTKNKNCKFFRRLDIDPDAPSMLYVESRGRLGNQIYTYAFMSLVSNITGTQGFINGRTKLILENAFSQDALTLPVLEEVYCNTKDIRFENYHMPITVILEDPSLWKGRLIWLYPPNPNGKSYGGFWPNDYEMDGKTATFIGKMHQFAKSNFKHNFKTPVREKAEKMIRDVAQQVTKTKPSADITFIGIHNRRTDHIEFSLKFKDKPITPKYFYEAMDYYREEYDNVAFLYVSDDMEWGRKKIKNKHKDLYFVGLGTDNENGPDDNWQSENSAVDFAVLANCNHSISTKGTYSLFSAQFAAGENYSFTMGPYLADEFLLKNGVVE